MKLFWAFIVLSGVALAQAAPDAIPAEKTLADFGLSYPLSSDWILATTMMRKQFSAQNPSSRAFILLAAVFVPENAKFSGSNPFFSLLAIPFAHPDCKKVLDATVQDLEQQDKVRVEKADEELSIGDRRFYRTDFQQKGVLRQRSLVCTAEKEHILLWNVAARDGKGVETVISTLNSITPATPSKETADSNAAPLFTQSSPVPMKVQVSSRIMGGRVIRKVAPSYPLDAREQHIQGTVVLKAEINKEGDIANLEVVDGPMELVGSAVAAVRRWKYQPYLLQGEPVVVETQIEVNYALRWN